MKMGIFDVLKPDMKKMEAKEDIKGLIKALQHKDSAVRIEAVDALSTMYSDRAVEGLIQALKDEDPTVRTHAAQALDIRHDRRAIVALTEALKDKHPEVRSFAAQSLGILGKTNAGVYDVAGESLIQALKDRDFHVREIVAWALRQVKWRPRDDRERLLYSATRWSRLYQLGELSIELVMRSLKHEDRSVRREAAEAAGEIGDKKIVSGLIEALRDKDRSVRRSAARSLGRIGDTRAIEPLVGALRDEEVAVSECAKTALRSIGEPTVGPLIQVLRDKDWFVRSRAAWILGCLGDGRALEPLKQALRATKEADILEMEEAITKIEKNTNRRIKVKKS